MENTFQGTIAGVLKGFLNKEGDKKLQVASLWEDVSKEVTNKSQILKIDNKIIFIKVTDPIIAQELKLKVQRTFLKKYSEKFGEKLKDIRFIIGN